MQHYYFKKNGVYQKELIVGRKLLVIKNKIHKITEKWDWFLKVSGICRKYKGMKKVKEIKTRSQE